MDRNICCPTSPNIPKGIWDLIRKLPTLRYMLPPVLNKEELYSRYSYRDLEPNNFAYVVDENTINSEVAEISFINVNDNTVEGLRYKNGNVLTVQFHPEVCPGPQDSNLVFDEFIAMMESRRK
mgnify:CR=1 FL=1